MRLWLVLGVFPNVNWQGGGGWLSPIHVCWWAGWFLLTCSLQIKHTVPCCCRFRGEEKRRCLGGGAGVSTTKLLWHRKCAWWAGRFFSFSPEINGSWSVFGKKWPLLVKLPSGLEIRKLQAEWSIFQWVCAQAWNALILWDVRKVWWHTPSGASPLFSSEQTEGLWTNSKHSYKLPMILFLSCGTKCHTFIYPL